MQFHALFFIGKPLGTHSSASFPTKLLAYSFFTSSRSQAFIHLIQRTAPFTNLRAISRCRRAILSLASTGNFMHSSRYFSCVFCRYFTDYFSNGVIFVIFVFFLLTFLLTRSSHISTRSIVPGSLISTEVPGRIRFSAPGLLSFPDVFHPFLL